MAEIRLLNITAELSEALARPSEFEAQYSALLGDNAELITEVVGSNEVHHDAVGAQARWGGYLAVDVATNFVVGTCAYKGAPDGDATVEIAYFTFPNFERRGFATAMARELELQVRESEEVERIVAHTLPEESPATRVLRRLEYSQAGDITDPEDGPIWRWERTLRPPT